jgi:hypothetical protein
MFDVKFSANLRRPSNISYYISSNLYEEFNPPLHKTY